MASDDGALPTMDVSFEDLTAATHGAVRDLILDGLAEHWGVVDESLNPDLDDMLTAYRAGRTLVARDHDGRIIGTGTLRPHRDAEAEIVRMSVRRDARRFGLGRRLVDELIAIARGWGVEAVVLETTTSWTDAVAFYTRCGFDVTHVEVGEFGSDTWFRLELQ